MLPVGAPNPPKAGAEAGAAALAPNAIGEIAPKAEGVPKAGEDACAGVPRGMLLPNAGVDCCVDAPAGPIALAAPNSDDDEEVPNAEEDATEENGDDDGLLAEGAGVAGTLKVPNARSFPKGDGAEVGVEVEAEPLLLAPKAKDPKLSASVLELEAAVPNTPVLLLVDGDEAAPNKLLEEAAGKVVVGALNNKAAVTDDEGTASTLFFPFSADANASKRAWAATAAAALGTGGRAPGVLPSFAMPALAISA